MSEIAIGKHIDQITTSILLSEKKDLGHIKVKTFDVLIKDITGTLSQHPLEIMYQKNQDVVDVIAHYMGKDGQIYISTATNLRPVLTTREQLGVTGGDDRLREGAYIIFDESLGDIGFEDAIKRGLEKKLGLKTDKLNFGLAGSYFPAVGSSAEVAISCYVSLDASQQPSEIVAYGSGFDGERVIESVSLQNIVDDFFSDKTSDMRLLFHALYLAQQYGISLIVPQQSPAIQHTIGQLHDFVVIDDIRQRKQTSAYLEGKHQQYSIEIEENNKQPSFIKPYEIDTINHCVDGTQQNYHAVMSVRNGIDTIDTMPYCRADGKLYIIAKYGLRPVLKARDREPHHIPLSQSRSNIEIISGPRGKDDPCNQAQHILTQKCGNFGYADIKTLGSYYPSGGNNPEKTSLVSTQINPNSGTPSGRREFDTVDTPLLAIELQTLFQLYRQNIIKDPRLLLAAYLLQQQTSYQSPVPTLEVASESDINQFYEALNTPLQIDRFYKESAAILKDPKLYDLHVMFKHQSPWYRKVMSYIEQELGGFFATEMLHSESDKHFFDAAVPSFAVPSAELADKYQNYAAHDGGHYVQGTVVPAHDMTKETYVRLMSKTESLAVFDSDYRYPLELGINIFEQTIGGHKSVATSFHNLGIDDPREVRHIITKIEVDAVIPEKIMHHPNYEEERINIVHRILRFHFMDKIQASHQFDQRMKHPILMDVMLRFANCVGSEQEFEQKMNYYENIIEHHSEGINTVKAHIIRTMTKDIVMPAITMGLVLQMLTDNGASHYNATLSSIHHWLDDLAKYQSQLRTIHQSITGIEANEHNIRAVKLSNEITQQVRDITQQFEQTWKTCNLLTSDQIARLTDNGLPYFTGFAQMPENLTQLVEECEQHNKYSYGL